MVFTLDNYARLLDPLWLFEVLLHFLNMALIATLSPARCWAILLPALGEVTEKIQLLVAVFADCSFLTNSPIRGIYGAKNIPEQFKGYLTNFCCGWRD